MEKELSERVQARVTPAERKAIERQATIEGRSVSNLIRMAMKKYIKSTSKKRKT